MPRKNRPLDRTTGLVRDSSIVVIACEDTHAVKQYFAKFRTRRVQFKVLPAEEGYRVVTTKQMSLVYRLARHRSFRPCNVRGIVMMEQAIYRVLRAREPTNCSTR